MVNTLLMAASARLKVINSLEIGAQRGAQQRYEDFLNYARRYSSNSYVFGISQAPKAIKALAANYEINLNDVDLFTFHQANLFMNEKIRNKLKLEAEKVPYSMQEFGNTSCASIPLTLVTRRAEQLRNGRVSHIACGFGVGLSWGAMHFETENLVIPELIEL